MESKDMRSQNDNLSVWRKKREGLTQNLLKKALLKLEKIKAEISQKNASIMMEELASDEDRKYKANIKPSAISKNKVLKAMVHEAQGKIKAKENESTQYTLDVENQYNIFKLKAIIAKKDAKIKEYENIFQRANLKDEKAYTVELPSDTYKLMLEDLIRICIDDGFLYSDENQKNILLEDDG